MGRNCSAIAAPKICMELISLRTHLNKKQDRVVVLDPVHYIVVKVCLELLYEFQPGSIYTDEEPTASLRKSGALWQLNSALRSLVSSQSLNSGPFLKTDGEHSEGPNSGT